MSPHVYFIVIITFRILSINSALFPLYFVTFGPFKIVLAFCRSSNNDDKHRANTDSPIKVTGIP